MCGKNLILIHRIVKAPQMSGFELKLTNDWTNNKIVVSLADSKYLIIEIYVN